MDTIPTVIAEAFEINGTTYNVGDRVVVDYRASVDSYRAINCQVGGTFIGTIDVGLGAAIVVADDVDGEEVIIRAKELIAIDTIEARLAAQVAEGKVWTR